MDVVSEEVALQVESTKARLLKRLSGYWQLELMNVWLLPLAAMICVVSLRGTVTVALVLSLIATSWLLIIGTIALRMMLKDLERDATYAAYWLPKLRLAKAPSLVLVAITVLITCVNVVVTAPSLTVTQYCTIAFTVLATLEYINYYHYQLQHFDNLPDFQRLISGNGFRQSHLARALKRLERTKS
jgi:hypothetical protein